ncbi:MAG: hypothetical protein CVV42_08315 [Candidatus Riflebacteria bacterium HGW-Riflebacteria-2]|jgi:hypothetical protein|nr:MAG: hypothetical protein CVV42_08315 [Candidatus Riflebacteria bacterium HGW-Riflebacteria-2]
MRAGSGKSTILANLSIYLNNNNQRIAIVDLDSETPLKLKNCFPRSISLQEYADISLSSQHTDSRYQKNFYFTETNLISYFPAHKLKDATLLFSDTTLRDFFIQITACFDTVLVNFPAGPQHSRQASQLLSRQHLWRGKSPVSVIVSQSDEKSLVSLDGLISENPAFYYQLQENTLLLFNRVPTSVEDQKLAENTLNSLELRTLFNFPATYVIGISEEYAYQRTAAAPLVLDQNSVIQQTFSSLQRMLAGTTKTLGRALYEQTGDYQPCLDGQLLEKLSPYLEKIQNRSAQRLFQHPSNLQVFLEENDGNYRIRIRLTGVKQPLASIERKLPLEINHSIRQRLSPAIWPFRRNYELPEHEKHVAKVERPNLAVKPVYRFDDRFAGSLDWRLRCKFDLNPERGRYPSPILFRPSLGMQDIPSLSEVLGYLRKQYKKCAYAPAAQAAPTGVTHFFIPPEFDLVTCYNPVFIPDFTAVQTISDNRVLLHNLKSGTTGRLLERAPACMGSLPDVFARNWPIEPESKFAAEVSCVVSRNFNKKSLIFEHARHSQPIIKSAAYLERGTALPQIEQHEIPAIIYISVSAVIGLPPSATKPLRNQDYQWRDSFGLRHSYYKPFALNLATNLQLVILQTREEDASENLFKFTFREEAKAFRTSIFTKVARTSPEIFALEQAWPVRENYIPFAQLNLPENFKLADVMVDHCFPPTVYKLAHKSSLSTEISSRLYCFSHPTVFRQTYNEPVAEQMQKHLPLERADIKHKFIAAGHDYHSLTYRRSKPQPALRDDVLKTTFKHEQFKNYRDISNIQAMRTDVMLFASAKPKKFSPAKGKITDIRTVLGRPPVLSSLPTEKRLFPQASLPPQHLVYRQLSCRKQPEKFSAETAPHLVQIIAGQGSRPMLNDKMYKSDSLHITHVDAVFNVEVPELYTLSIRIGSRQIYHAVSASLKDRIEITTTIETTQFDYQHVYSELFIEPDFCNAFPSFSDCPLRTRKIELPNSLGFPTLSSEREALDHADRIVFKKDKSYAADYGHLIPAIRPSYDRLLLKRLSLPKAASKTWQHIEAGRKHFRPLFPDGIETLYRHLLWSFAARKRQPVAFSGNYLEKVDGVDSSFSTGEAKLVHFASFRDKGLAPAGKLAQCFLRDAIKVSKLRLKDVMSMARQASEQFSQVNSRLRA